ncbi:MAG TPA: septum formation initiator [Desulfitobacteriaceae bacterium]|nr:septum formation initiator [Desulfitobacteriaceae bacterium]
MALAQKKVLEQPKQYARKPARRANRQARLRSLLILVAIAAVTGAIGVETLNLTVVKAAEVHALEKDITALKANNDLLQVKVDQLRSIGRIESSALAMGMEKPEGTVYISKNIAVLNEHNNASVSPQTIASLPENEKNNSIVKQFAHIITGFFTSNQS